MQPLVDAFKLFAQTVPLELFVFVGTFIEELISPIPSFLVLVPSGAGAHFQGHAFTYLLLLALLSGFGRIIAGTILYFFADKAEDWLLGRGRKMFGISHREVERFGQQLGHKGIRDWLILFLMNAVPIFPGVAISLASGFIRVRFDMFLICTFFGTMVNALIYLSIGYYGLEAAGAMHAIEYGSQITIALFAVLAFVFLIIHRKRTVKRKV